MHSKRSTVFNALVLAALLAGLFGPRPVFAATIRYASPAGLSSGACDSWAAACGLAYAITQASAGDEIWVAAGTYPPTSGADRTLSFTLKEGVAIYGGFAGTETLRSQRSWTANLTTLSGEINAAGTADNSYHVVTGSGLTAGSVLDGFTITAGNANGSSPQDSGGGIFLTHSSPTLVNLRIHANQASRLGGGLENEFSSPTLTNLMISANSAPSGGAMFNYISSPILTNVTFSANSALNGSGLYNNDFNSHAVLRNCILWGNSGWAISGGANSGASSVSYSLVQGGYAGTGNINLDPLFINAGAGDFRLHSGSPAINAGNNALLPVGLITDLAGNPRIWNTTVDMGAYEFAPHIFVKAGASGSNTGESWANAFTGLQSALSAAQSGDEIWVAAGTYKPTSGTDRNISFDLKEGVALYGGFAGTETLTSQRNWNANLTILSGEIGAAGAADNSYHVLKGSGLTAGSVLDGFTITAGNSSGVFPNDGGGGMRLTTSGPTLANLTFSANSATYGGGMYLESSSPTLANVIFRANSAAYGGGIFDYVSSNPTLTNVTFSANSAATSGGGVYIDSSSPTLTNVSFNGNSAASGGGIYNLGSSPNVRNSILWGNTAANGPQIFIPFGVPSIVNSLVQGGYTGTGNIDVDPLFVNTAAGDLHLRTASPAIDAGNSAVASPGLPAGDLDGQARIAGGSVDLGAYETQSPNHAPVLSPLADWNLLEDPAANPGQTVASLLAGKVSDADGTAASAGAAVYARDNSHGKWQTSPDGAAWADLPAVSASAAALLGPGVHLRFAPNANWNGSAAISLRAWDGADGRSSGATGVDLTFNGASSAFSASPSGLTVVVAPVNDAPSFTRGADLTVKPSAGAYSGPWASAISPGPADEAGQTLVFSAGNDNNSLFSVQPAIAPDGTLSFTPAAGAFGSAVVSVTLKDNGGGTDSSPAATFTIRVADFQVFLPSIRH